MAAEATNETESLTSAIRLTSAFYSWERRGRGWDVSTYPVVLEPAFRPFYFHPPATVAVHDDARKPSAVSTWLSRLVGRPATASRSEPDEQEEPEPDEARDLDIVEIQIALPPDVKVAPELAEHFLLSLSTCAAPVSFEVVASSDTITIQVACDRGDAALVQEQVRAYFPDAVISEATEFLAEAWKSGRGMSLVVDFGLSQEFMRPLKSFSRFDADPLIGLLGCFGDLVAGEVVTFQVLFQSARAPWADSINRSVTDWQGEAFFVDAPELVPLTKEKLNRPLFAVVIRVATKCPDHERRLQLAKRFGGACAQLGNPASNELIALSNDDYPDELHERDVLDRHTHRSGMLLNTEELVSLVHPPSVSVRATRLTREHRRTKAVPKTLLGHELTLGTNTHGGVTQQVTIGPEQRLRHTHLIGASGTGKSTLLLNMLVQDMNRGNGLALIDPHGDLIDQVLAHVPEARINDVILVDPADTEYPVGFNILSAHSDLEKTLLSSDLVAVFRRLSTSWGDQMTSVLSNAVLAFLESPRGGTLADLRRFLVEAEFRKDFLTTVQDREVVYYWQKEFPLLTGRPQAPLLTRLDAFLRPKLVRGMMTQAEGLDFTNIMNSGKILLVKLAQGAIGEENAAFLGSLFVAKIHQLALGRQSIAESDRRPFYVYLDEFQHFVTPSMATLLTGARKYRIGLVLAHQELRQLWNQDRDVAGAILANAATRICFRVGDDDAKKLEDGFTGFSARDIQNLQVGQAICRVDRVDSDFSLDAPAPPAPVKDELLVRERVTIASRQRYAGRPSPIATAVEEDVLRPATERHQSTRDAVSEIRLSPKPRSSTPKTEPKPAALGRGGSQHKYLQELIRRWAGANGWMATVEKPILDGLGSVDVALEKDGRSIACEVSVNSTIDYEIGNIRKCLTAGFGQVVSIVVEKRVCEKLKAAVSEQIEDTFRRSIHVVVADELFVLLSQFGRPTADTQETVLGYDVRVKRTETAQQQASRQTIARTVIGALRRIRGRT